jgi:hypothetical protein
MKLRSHRAPLACIFTALACLAIPVPASAQEFLLPGYIPPGMPYRAGGGFYVQAGIQFRNVEKFLMQKKPDPARFVDSLGVAPFGPCSVVNGAQDTHCTDTIMGTGTGVPGYPPDPTGVTTDCPNVSGIWYYDNGFINPNGDTFDNPNPPPATLTGLWPDVHPFGAISLPGLGKYATTGTDPFNLGIFGVTAPPLQIGGTSGTPGFDINNPPTMNNTFSVTWERVLNGILFTGEPAGCGYEASRILVARGVVTNLSFAEQPVSPTFELGYQWGDYFDLFFGFSWFSLKESFSKAFDTTADTYRRVIQDTFPFTSDNTALWPSGNFTSSTVVGENNINQQMLPDSGGLIGFPRRAFLERLDTSVPPVPVVEHTSARTDLSAYEFKLGARSWVPMYGLGKFGFSIGPLMNLINYRASASEIMTFINEPTQPMVSSFIKNQGWLTTWGFFFGTDLEIVSNVYFVRGSVLYSVQQQASVNADPVETVFNMNGLTALLAAGLQF